MQTKAKVRMKPSMTFSKASGLHILSTTSSALAMMETDGLSPGSEDGASVSKKKGHPKPKKFVTFKIL